MIGPYFAKITEIVLKVCEEYLKCEKEYVKVCESLKSWMPLHRCFHRYLKLQIQINNARVMKILSFSQNQIFHMHKIVLWHWIRIWDLMVPQIKNLKKTEPLFSSVFYNFFIRALLRPQIVIPFWSLRYLWKHLCKGMQDFRLSHTFTYSFSHFHTLFTHFSHNLSYYGQIWTNLIIFGV